MSGEGIAPDGASDAPSTLASEWALSVLVEDGEGRGEAFTELQRGCPQLCQCFLEPPGLAAGIPLRGPECGPPLV